MEKSYNNFTKYLAYFNERLPIVGAMLYGATTFYAIYFFAPELKGYTPSFLTGSFPGFIIFFFSIVHLRVLDEHKDYKRDIIAHPDRLLSRGIITLKDLRKVNLYPLYLE